ncbi:ComEC/Rec2 family competence protein [Mycoplasma sp. E35C]|uniref:ComEC/Rec2 family competence protein n=1 Tax=Mycoplasma sp. E35C TaxID=2801918 RepID=UPI001CA3E63B|nr:ComEC/Rec2 family competence protein [Mycoplasma sp. E35C]QZX49003.1 ComEC/Rec2 family competence protein [Mycoplasma sp. E35C]
MEIKIKTNIKQNYPLALLFCLISLWILGYNFNQQSWVLIGILVVVFIVVAFFLFHYSIAILIVSLLVLFSIYYFVYYKFQIKGIVIKDLLDKIPQEYDLRKIIIDYLNTNTNKQSRGFLLLTLFNVKNNDNKLIYQQILNLSIAHLLVISGLHLSLINLVILKIFKKHKIIGNFASFSILFFYSFLLSFSYGVLRVLIGILLNLILEKFIKKGDVKLLSLSISGMLLLLLNPYSFKNYSYILSYLSVIVISMVFKINKLNNFMKTLIASVLINFIVGGLIVNAFGKINILTIFWSIILSPIIIGIYFINLFLFPFSIAWSFLGLIHKGFFIVIDKLQINLLIIKLTNLVNWIPFYYLIIYYLFISSMWIKRLI